MATTTNNQDDEPRTTTLERQVQTLTAIVERLTKQNHDLKEQLWQKNASLNTLEEDQEGTKRGQKATMPLVDKNDRIPANHPAQIRLLLT